MTGSVVNSIEDESFEPNDCGEMKGKAMKIVTVRITT